MEQKEPLLEVKDLIKNFGETRALRSVSFKIYPGEIRGLIGENGSGKSTASTIISGVQPANSGSMTYKGKEWKPKSALDAEAHGIGMVVQEAGTIARITVAENIFLGEYKKFTKFGMINAAKMNAAAKEALKMVGLEKVSPYAKTETIDFQTRKLIELARVMKNNPELLIIDETTTALSQEGREVLYKSMHMVAERGGSVLLISHDLSEMMEHCDVLTVLKDGEVAGELKKEEFDETTIKRLMVGRELWGAYYREDNDPYEDTVVLRAENLTTIRSLLCLNLELHRGEILGIGGLSDSGMHELGRALFGLEEVVFGSVSLPEKNKKIKNASEAFDAGMGYVSKDRDTESLERNASIRSNILSAGYEHCQYGPFSSGRKEHQYVQKQIKSLSIKCQNEHQLVRYLSGGNKQKVVFAKWIAADSDILILDCPTRGVDIGVKAQMYHLINELKHNGKGIIIISEEMSELRGMCDRLLIMKDGKIRKSFMRTEGYDENEIIEYMI